MKILKAPILTHSQTDVLYYLSHGLSAKEIAKELNRSEDAIESRIYGLLMKMNCKNQKHLVAEAFRLHIIE